MFFVRNPDEMLEFLEKRAEIRREKRWIRRLRRELDLARRFPLIRKAGIIGNPLKIAYFSQTPYRLGPRAVVKYQARPREIEKKALSTDSIIGGVVAYPASKVLRRLKHRDYLRSAMGTTFDQGHDVVFDFMVQRQTTEQEMPIEDPTQEWDEKAAPFVPVATITIRARENQQFQFMDRFAEDLCFSPWHCLKEHEPLGSINEARREVYRQMARYRHDRNNVHYEEPTGVNDAIEARSRTNDRVET